MRSRAAGYLFLFGAVTAVSSCANGVPAEPDGTVQVLAPGFSSVESMVVQSDLVVIGTVEDVTPGRKVGSGSEEIQYRDVTVKVEQTLFSRLNAKVSSAVVQELGWSNGKAVEPSEWSWSKEGDRGYFILQNDVDGKFGYLGPQARILIENGGLHSGGEHDVPAIAKVNALTPEALSAQIRAAAQKIETQRIPNPAGPAVGDDVTR